MTEIKIYNRNQIGGNFTVISCNGKKIMIDYGMALPGSPVEQEEFDWENDKVDAVFFTHYHGDHVGRILEIPKEIPLYMGKTARLVMLNIHKALAGVEELHDEQMQYVSLLNDKERIHEFRAGVACKKIGDIEVIPYFVDHSAYDAYMFLIITPDETILHTGDFRTHGYRGSKLFLVLERLVLPRVGGCIDSLIIEGTMMERGNEKVLKEPELQQEAAKICKENKYVFLVCSSTNLDTLASFYQAALSKGMYTYCYSKYLLGQLETFSKTAGRKSELYMFRKAYLVEFQKLLKKKEWKKAKTQEQIMREMGFLCIIRPGDKYAEWIERFADLKPKIVYALWNGYLDPNHAAYNKEWAVFFEPYRKSEQFKELHTSGHATPETIAKVIETVKPRKRIYPMHTGKAEEFRKLEIEDEYKGRLEI